MNQSHYWSNFDLGEEVAVAGAFIFNALRRFHEMDTLDHNDEIFEFFYNSAVGLERILKVAVALLEYDAHIDHDVFERSLVTHEHLDLLARIRARVPVCLGAIHNDFLALLAAFYRDLRYDRYQVVSRSRLDRERSALTGFLSKHLHVDLKPQTLFATRNGPRFRKHVAKLVCGVAREIYRVVQERARQIGVYTYELRSGSKAERVFLADDPTFLPEDILWKELLIFFMNAEPRGGRIKFLKTIDPLPFDPALALDYLRCFTKPEAAADVMGELEVLYEDLGATKERLEMLAAVDDERIEFSGDDDEPDDDAEEEARE